MEERLLKEVNYQMLLVSDDIEDLLNQMNYVAPTIGKWITTETTWIKKIHSYILVNMIT
jgi:hypothetical protein